MIVRGSFNELFAMLGNIMGNPYSRSPSDELRQQTLENYRHQFLEQVMKQTTNKTEKEASQFWYDRCTKREATIKRLLDELRDARGKQPEIFKCPSCGHNKFGGKYVLVLAGLGMLWWRKWFGKENKVEGLQIQCYGCQYTEIVPLGFVTIERELSVNYNGSLESQPTGRMIMNV
jgi:hypothetical protein